MKLYTEQQVRELLWNYMKPELEGIDEVINTVIPIRIPSSDEIEVESWKSGILRSQHAFIIGANFVLKQINQQL